MGFKDDVFFLNEIDRLRQRDGQARVMIHPETARTRGIADGDPVRVFIISESAAFWPG